MFDALVRRHLATLLLPEDDPQRDLTEEARQWIRRARIEGDKMRIGWACCMKYNGETGECPDHGQQYFTLEELFADHGLAGVDRLMRNVATAKIAGSMG